MAAEFQSTERFSIRRRIGAGGMGVVYEAYDRERQASIALKTLRNPSPDAILRLKNEFRALQNVQHRNLVHLGELFEEDGVWFFTMELVEGQRLLEYLRPDAPRPSPEATAVTDDVRMTAPTMAPLPNARDVSVPVIYRPIGAVGPGAASAPRSVRIPVASAFDEARVRDVLAQLARGLSALHRAGKVHRDVKPSNILVDRSGRVVLLDFGLVADTERGPALTEVGVVGTAAYMAPEQALGKPVGPEADWYSLGVVLYEALTGTLPFQGSTLHILMEKQRLQPSRPVTHIADVPADLDRMCVELLEFDPHKRPTGAAIMRRLGVAESPGASAPAPLATRSATTMTQAFVGRDAELGVLAGALADVRDGRLVCVYVQGESGIGKSALVHTFCKQAAEEEGVVLLTGRCYERETVRYRLLDGVIDALARYLQRLPKPEAAALTPARVSLLLQVFPVLKRVDVFADAPRHEAIDPQELRARAFGALRELFARLSDRRTLIVAIDDLQWADVDGLELLGELMRPPDAPAFLLVGSWRETGEDPGLVKRVLTELPGEHREVHLDHLSEAAACDLAERLLVHAGIADTRLAAQARLIAREAHGHPLYIDELVRYSAVPEADTSSRPFRLEDVLWARIGRLDEISLRVLEVVAVAGAPIEQEIAARAAGLDLGTLGRHAGLLRVANLVRTTGSRSTDTVEPYHDRVRHAILTHLPEEARVSRHRELARALDASGRADPEDLMEHYRGAREPARAGQCAAQAAANAAGALAFDQAARLYQLALSLSAEDDPARRGLRVLLGDALANGGRGHEAALAYLDAAAGAGAAETLDLQLRAAQQLLLTGHIDEGVAIVRTFLDTEGIGYPRSPRHALVLLLARRAQLKLRGRGFTERDESLIPPKDLKRLDVCFSVGVSLGLVDNIIGLAFHARGLLLALRAGEPVRLARAMLVEGAGRAAAGGKHVAEGNEIMATAERLATKASNVQVLALTAACRAQSYFLCGQFRTALEHCERARAILGERCVGAAWERTAIDLYSVRALHWLGDLDRLVEWMPVLLREFRRCNNQYAVTSLSVTMPPFLHLAADDDPAISRAEVAEAMARWPPTGFHIQHYQAIHAEVATRLYHGDPASAHAHLCESWPAIERSLLLRVQFIRVVLHDLRARTAIAAAGVAGEGARAALLAGAARDVAVLRKAHEPWATALADASDAGIARLRGDDERARTRLTAALGGFEAAEMGLHVSAARHRLGLLVDGAEGRSLVAAAEAYLTTHRVKRPEKMAALILPFRI